MWRLEVALQGVEDDKPEFLISRLLIIASLVTNYVLLYFAVL